MKSVTASLRTFNRRQPGFGTLERDVVALGIAVAAIIMFVGTGSAVVPQAVRSLLGLAENPHPMLVNALLLNIALILFGWRRYRQMCEELEQRRIAEIHARKLADTDPLTSCLNRRSLCAKADRMLEESAAHGDVVAVLMIDLDNFKQVNDFHGHAAGDEILIEVSRRIRDTLPADALLARLGGDEFACAFRFDRHRPESVERIANQLTENVSFPVPINGAQVRVTTSIGLVRSDTARPPGTPNTVAYALIHMADNAMYHAKKQGRHQHVWFEAPMEDELRFRNEIETGIRNGIPLGEFVPFYEQQIDLQTGEISGFEVLARWRSPTLGIVTPDIFIPIAEEIGAIAELSESVIAQALKDARGWDARLTLSVNISPVQLRDPWFAQKLLKLLVSANFPPERLEVEITESCLHENLGMVRSVISSLKNQGIKVSLDDFGTGYSSLAQLRNLPFDRIKIDRSFVSNLRDDQNAETIVHAIAFLGRGLGLPVTAEGIECATILEKLRLHGDIKGQGYLYGEPKPADETERELRERDLIPTTDAESSPAPANIAPSAPRRIGTA